MKENITCSLHDESQTLMEWQEPHSANLPGMIEAIRHIKDSINDYLTHLVSEKKGEVCNVKDVTEYFDSIEEEQEEDGISGLIKNMANVHEKCTTNIKCHSNYSTQRKKFKK